MDTHSYTNKCVQCEKNYLPKPKGTSIFDNNIYCSEVCFLAECLYCPVCMEKYEELVVCISSCHCYINESICKEGHYWYIDWNRLTTIIGKSELHGNIKCKGWDLNYLIKCMSIK